MSQNSARNEGKTIELFGKPYHWVRDADGDLTLVPGVTPAATNLKMGDLIGLAKRDKPS